MVRPKCEEVIHMVVEMENALQEYVNVQIADIN